MDKIVLSKVDVIRRQLNQAIQLYFMDADPVSVYTLVSAASEVNINLMKLRGIISSKDQLLDLVMDHKQKDFINLMNEAQNFFKHADRDPESLFDFKPKLIETRLLMSIYDYGELTGNITSLMETAMVWLLSHNPDYIDRTRTKVIQEYEKKLKDNISSIAKKTFYENRLELHKVLRKIHDTKSYLPQYGVE